MVAKVNESFKNNPKKITRTFAGIEEITKSFAKVITGEKGFDIKELIKVNETFLEDLKVVSKSTKELVRQLEKIGAVAKVSGAGGYKAESGILIAYHKVPEKLLKIC